MQLFDLRDVEPSSDPTHRCVRTAGEGADNTCSLTHERSSALKWPGDCGCPASTTLREWLSTVPKLSGAWRAAISAVTPPRLCPASTVCVRPPLSFRVFGAKGWQQAFGNVEHQLAATAEDCDAFTRVDVINAEYGHRRDASAADGGVNGGAYPKMVEPDLAIREYQ